MTNLDVHVFETRTGFWKARLEGLPSGRVYVGGEGCKTPAEALEAAAGYLRSVTPSGIPNTDDHPLGCRCRRCE